VARRTSRDLHQQDHTVGASYTGLCNRIYLYADEQGVVPREMMQMVGRVREPEEPDIRMFLETKFQPKDAVLLKLEDVVYHSQRL